MFCYLENDRLLVCINLTFKCVSESLFLRQVDSISAIVSSGSRILLRFSYKSEGLAALGSFTRSGRETGSGTLDLFEAFTE